MGAGDQRFAHGAAHLLLLGAVFPAGHLGGDLVQTRHAVVPRGAGFGVGSARGAEDIEVVEPVGLEVLEVLVRHRT